MSTFSLGYASQDRVSIAVKLGLRREAEALRTAGPGIIFYDDATTDDPIMGMSQLFPPDPAQCARASEDLQYVIRQLSRWSEAYGIRWVVMVADAEIGTIAGAWVDPAIVSFIDALQTIG